MQVGKVENLSAISHEIRTPLHSMLGLTGLLLKNNPRPDQLPYLQGLQQSASLLLALVNDLLDYSKLGAGKLVLHKEPFTVCDVLKALHAMVAPSAEEKGLSLQLELPTCEPPLKLLGDAVRLSQILGNLLTNAIKFTGNGGIRLKAELIGGNEDSCTLQFSVKDTGIGIAQGEIEEIFEPFHQGSDEIGRIYGGTGLGLSIVKKLVDAHQGKVWAESEEGKGSTFYVELSYQKAQNLSEPLQPIFQEDGNFLQPEKPAHALSLKGLKVLLIEDSRVNRLLVRGIVNSWGADAIEAENGTVALEKLKALKPSIILSDLNLPDIHGNELVKAIRNELGFEGPIIALTAHADSQCQEASLAAGFDGFLSKPFTPQQLMNCISRNLVKL